MNFCVLRFPIRCQIATCFSKGENSKIKHFKIPHTDKTRLFEISFVPKFAVWNLIFTKISPFEISFLPKFALLKSPLSKFAIWFLIFFPPKFAFLKCIFWENSIFWHFFVRIFLCRFLRANWARKIERKEPFSMHEKMLTGLIGLSVRSFAFNDFWPFPIFSPHQN